MTEKPTTAAGYTSEQVAHLRPLLVDSAAAEVIHVLRRDSLDHDGIGARRVAEFQTGGPDDAIQADVVGLVRQLLEHCGYPMTDL